MKLIDLRNKKIHLVGLAGAEGSSLAFFLINLGCRHLIGHDFSTKANFRSNYFLYHQEQSVKINKQQLLQLTSGLQKINFRDNYLKEINEAEIIFATSSWFRYRFNQPLKKTARQKVFWNWYNFLLEFYPGIIIGVTGTAGKGTTCSLIYLILKTAGQKVWQVGDSWTNFNLQSIFKSSINSYVVAELSNRTLTFAKYSKKSPSLAVITNITKNHLDDHQGSFRKYLETKKEIARYQNKGDYLMLNRTDEQTGKFKSLGQGKKISISSKSSDKKLIVNKNIFGEDYQWDALAAIKIAKILKIKNSQIIKGLNKFQARPGRLQVVKKLNNILFINDSTATRPLATQAAVKSLNKYRINLILEGSRQYPDKKQFTNLLKILKQNNVKQVAVSGQISKLLVPLLKKFDFSFYQTKNLTASFKKIIKTAQPGEVVLLSPSCESFGEFKDYRQRLEKFNQLVESYGNEKSK